MRADYSLSGPVGRAVAVQHPILHLPCFSWPRDCYLSRIDRPAVAVSTVTSGDRRIFGEDHLTDGRYAKGAGALLGCVGPVRSIALPGAGFVPYAGAVPDGGRHGFKAARTVASPHRLAA